MTLKNPGAVTFEAQILSDEESGGAFIQFPFKTEELFGTRGRVPVQVTIDGEPYRGSLVRMGLDCHLLPVIKDIRHKIGKQAGDTIQVTVLLDEKPRVIEVPPAFQAILQGCTAASETFNNLSYSHQRQYILWIEEAKKEETRQRRMAKAIDLLTAGKSLR